MEKQRRKNWNSPVKPLKFLFLKAFFIKSKKETIEKTEKINMLAAIILVIILLFV